MEIPHLVPIDASAHDLAFHARNGLKRAPETMLSSHHPTCRMIRHHKGTRRCQTTIPRTAGPRSSTQVGEYVIVDLPPFRVPCHRSIEAGKLLACRWQERGKRTRSTLTVESKEHAARSAPDRRGEMWLLANRWAESPESSLRAMQSRRVDINMMPWTPGMRLRGEGQVWRRCSSAVLCTYRYVGLY